MEAPLCIITPTGSSPSDDKLGQMMVDESYAIPLKTPSYLTKLAVQTGSSVGWQRDFFIRLN